MGEYKLHDKQAPAFNKLMAQHRHLLLFRMGTGKTVVGTKFIYDSMAKSVIILAPKNAYRVWEDHIKEWFAGLDKQNGETIPTSYSIHMWRKRQQDPTKRRQMMNTVDSVHVNIYIMTPSALMRDFEHIKVKYDMIIIDEFKKVSSRKGKVFPILKAICKQAKHFVPMTGTPGRMPPDFWTMLHLKDPQYFSSYWKFVSTFCYTQKGPYGEIEVLGIRNKDAWYRLLNQHASFLTKEDLGKLPTKRQLLHVDMDEDQSRIYDQLDKEMMAISNDELIIAQTAMTKCLRLRQLLVCPKILDPKLSIGAAFADFTETIKDGNAHTVCFTPFTAAIPHFRDYLHAQGFANVFTLQGGIDPDEVPSRIAKWRETKGVMLCSIMYATSFSLQPASESYFVGYEWNPEDNAQAEERLDRGLETLYPINHYYYAYDNTYDEEQCDIVNIKQCQVDMTLNLKLIRGTKI